ncbi:hypothetical protein [Pseudaeromonas paramecii]|uniref:Uncharacterized protein n=1 Tax=Pseudaeromonas paramecii TaxID=2138166 RepID=A0ABP8PYT9_9GAMM
MDEQQLAHADPWDEYERRKKALQQQGLSQREYELAIRRLVDELGV